MKILLMAILIPFCLVLHGNRYGKIKPLPKDILFRVNYLERVINQPLNSNSDILKLGKLNHEFMLFSYAFSTYALTNIALQDTSYSMRAVKLIKTCIIKAQEARVAMPYGVNNEKLLFDSIPEYSVLYLGHLNLMMGCYRRLTLDTTFNRFNNNLSKNLMERYNKTPFLNLESYPHSIWVPDNAVAMASLKMHSFNTGSPYKEQCKKWVNYAKQHYLSLETKVLVSTIDPISGAALEEPRGSMLGWSMIFIHQFDSLFARELYYNYKKKFSKNYFVFRLFKERVNHHETSLGDIDSGPIFRGFSIPANEFALGNAVLAKDYKTIIKLNRLIKFGTKKLIKNNEVKYRVRFVDLNISPMAEALVLFSLTATTWSQ